MVTAGRITNALAVVSIAAAPIGLALAVLIWVVAIGFHLLDPESEDAVTAMFAITITVTALGGFGGLAAGAGALVAGAGRGEGGTSERAAPYLIGIGFAVTIATSLVAVILVLLGIPVLLLWLIAESPGGILL